MGLNKQQTSLLQKYEIPKHFLDYSHIEKCADAKELEKILIILRSGEEGTFPHLTQFCEERLKQVCPSSKCLFSSTNNFPSLHEKKLIEEDIQNWVREIKECEAKIYAMTEVDKECLVDENSYVFNTSFDMKHHHNFDRNHEEESSKRSRNNVESTENLCKSSRKPQNYSSWDKFNIEEELTKVEKQETESVQKSEKSKISCLESFLDKSGFSEEECRIIAEQEKIKGNEAFKVQDYAEAVVYYTHSISSYPLIAAMNNRALANIRLKNFTDALSDANAVLSLEPHNIKAIYRRGLVYKETSRLQLAYADFQRILELDPGNKAAKEQIRTIEKSPLIMEGSEKSSVMIEEVTSYTDKKDVCDTKITSVNSTDKTDGTPSVQQKTRQSVCGTNDNQVSSVPHSNQNHSSSSENICLKEMYEISSSLYKNEMNLEVDTQTVANLQDYHSEETLLLLQNEKVAKAGSHIFLKKFHDERSVSQTCPVTHSISHSYLENYSDKKNKVQESLQELEHGSNVLSTVESKITPFRFMTLWHSANANKDAYKGAIVLNKIPPENLPSVITNKLDGEFLFQLLEAISVIVQQGYEEKGYKYLKYLTEVPRIKTISSFLSQDEFQNLDLLLRQLADKGKDVTHLRSIFFAR